MRAEDQFITEMTKIYGQGFQILEASKGIGAGSATIALAGVGIGIGIVFNGLLNSFARNPRLKDELFRYTILGFALTEAIGLFALLMAFLIFFS
jgi:F-type H+-transporting ATPase subunit c